MAHQASFTEKELMNDLLMSEKQVASAYTTGITESSCTNLRDILTQCENNVLCNQESVFQAMSQRGWYTVKKAASQDVQSAKGKFNQMQHELR